MKLSPIAIKMVESTQGVKNKLAINAGRSELTIRRWLKSNNQLLTTESALRIIEKETGMKRNKILTK